MSRIERMSVSIRSDRVAIGTPVLAALAVDPVPAFGNQFAVKRSSRASLVKALRVIAANRAMVPPMRAVSAAVIPWSRKGPRSLAGQGSLVVHGGRFRGPAVRNRFR